MIIMDDMSSEPDLTFPKNPRSVSRNFVPEGALGKYRCVAIIVKHPSYSNSSRDKAQQKFLLNLTYISSFQIISY